MEYTEDYRYDGARQRYLVQVLDPDPTDPENVLSERWSDYDGDDVYGDFEIDEGNAVTVRSFEPGIARVTAGVSDGDAWTDYYRGDNLGTTRRLTDADGESIAPAGLHRLRRTDHRRRLRPRGPLRLRRRPRLPGPRGIQLPPCRGEVLRSIHGTVPAKGSDRDYRRWKCLCVCSWQSDGAN